MKTDSKTNKVGILGAGRQAAETAGYLIEAGFDIVFFFVMAEYKTNNNPLSNIAPIVTETDSLDSFTDFPVISAVGSPQVKKHLIDLWPYSKFTNFVHRTAWVSKSAIIGTDVTIPPMSVLNVETQIGDHVLLNVGDTLSHDVKIGEYCTISPGVNIAGKTIIGNGTFIGVGASIIDSIIVGEGAVVAAGSLVNLDVETNTLVAGIPAVYKKKLHSWY